MPLDVHIMPLAMHVMHLDVHVMLLALHVITHLVSNPKIRHSVPEI